MRASSVNRVILLMLAGVLLFGPGADGAFAQQSAPDTLKLDWDGAWDLALKHNESLKIAKNEVEKARRQVGEAYSAAFPTVDLNATFNHYFEIPVNPVVMPGELNALNPGQPFVAEFQFGQENNINGNIQLQQPLWLAGKIGLGLKVAKQYRKISKMGVEVSREDLRVTLLESFYGALIADEYLRVAEEALDQAKKYRDQVQDMYEEGVVSEYDLIRAKVGVSNTKPQVIQAEATRDLARKNLKNLLGLDLSQPVEIEGNLNVGLEGPAYDFATASQLATEQRLELRQLEIQEELYGYQAVSEDRNWLWPNFLAGLRYETTAQRGDFGFTGDDFYSGWSGQLILQIPLFDGFASRHRAEKARLNQRNARLQRQQLERGIKLQVFQGMRDYRKATEELMAAEENRAQAEKGYQIAEARYSGGVGTQLEVLDAQLQLNTSKVNVLQAKYNQLLAKARYERAIGSGFTVDDDK